MSDRQRKFKAHLTLYRMMVVALIGLVVGTISSFATIGFVEIVHWMNGVLYITLESRAEFQGSTLWIITILVPTLGGLIVGLILRYGVETGISLGPPETIYAVQLRERLPSPI